VRRYRARVFGGLDMGKLEQITRGITIDGIHYAPAEIQLENKTGRNAWLQVSLTEGKNREIRNILTHFDLAVNRLIRTSYGPFDLGTLPPGAVKEVTFSKIKTLYTSTS
jgi:23S rRNA pseudouridine2605 synthase